MPRHQGEVPNQRHKVFDASEELLGGRLILASVPREIRTDRGQFPMTSREQTPLCTKLAIGQQVVAVGDGEGPMLSRVVREGSRDAELTTTGNELADSNQPVACQSKRLLTDCSECVNRIAFDNSSPTLSTVNVEKQRSGGIAIVSVTATSVISDSVKRFLAGPESRACVAQQ